MAAKPTIEPREGYLLVTLPENYELTGPGAVEHWEELLAMCRERKCSKVLSVGTKPVRRMGVMDAYNSGVKASSFPVGLQVACLWADYAPDDLTRFFQNVARNRGATIEFFTESSAATAWLGIETPAIALNG